MKSFALSVERLSAKELLREGVLTLQAAHVESASLDARILLEHALDISREQLLYRMDDMMHANQIKYFRELVARRVRRQPIAQIIERREFFGLTFKVTSAVLDPRPDSETLIEAVIKRTRDKHAPLKILDLGTGSGCLLLTLLYEFPNAEGVGVDTSQDAISVAKDNAVNLSLQSRAAFVQSHWCMAVEGTYDIIVSNPPYIPAAEIAALAPEVAQYEPKQALDGGADGLACYRVILAALPKHLKKGGLAALELGLGQIQAVEALAKENHLTVLGVAHDIQGIARCIILTH